MEKLASYISRRKHQGNDVEKIKAGIKQNNDSDFMAAGNAIERVHKNILEFRNFMFEEYHFPYVVFLQGSNFATETFFVSAPDGRKVKVGHDSGMLNRSCDCRKLFCTNQSNILQK